MSFLYFPAGVATSPDILPPFLVAFEGFGGKFRKPIYTDIFSSTVLSGAKNFQCCKKKIQIYIGNSKGQKSLFSQKFRTVQKQLKALKASSFRVLQTH